MRSDESRTSTRMRAQLKLVLRKDEVSQNGNECIRYVFESENGDMYEHYQLLPRYIKSTKGAQLARTFISKCDEVGAIYSCIVVCRLMSDGTMHGNVDSINRKYKKVIRKDGKCYQVSRKEW